MREEVLIRNPIHRVLSTLSTHSVRHLLMGGQACVLYGGAEFSRDTDIVILADAANLARLRAALAELDAARIAVPDLRQDLLQKGHAVHFRCRHPSVNGIRIDLMSVLRGVAPFDELWDRRTTIEFEDGLRQDVIALPDLVRAKKTQRDKDWPMIRRLIEANYAQHFDDPSDNQIRFWLTESRTPEMLLGLATRFPDRAREASAGRIAVAKALDENMTAVARALDEEERLEREADRAYWEPLRSELEALRHAETGHRRR